MHTVTEDLSHIALPLRPLAVSIDSLNLDPANARLHDEKNLAAIKGSLARFGQRLPLVVQKQGMIVRAGNGRVVAAKMLGIWLGVNVTLGLPIIRTSVEHGTGFDNAGTGRGDPRSLVQALLLGATIATNRLRATGSAVRQVS